MPPVEKHPPGSFCWLELAGTDQEAAKDFYGKLFGWEAEDFPLGPSDVYSVFQLGGRATAAAFTNRQKERSRGATPHWLLYIAVESADAVAAQAPRLGGSVVTGPFDVNDFGRMAVIQDPAEAVFAVWQAKRNIGMEVNGVPGTLCWADLSTHDRERAQAFYSELFNWKLVKEGSDDYWRIVNGERAIEFHLPVIAIPRFPAIGWLISSSPTAMLPPPAPPNWALK